MQQTQQLGNLGASILFSQIALLEAVATLEARHAVTWAITVEAQ